MKRRLFNIKTALGCFLVLAIGGTVIAAQSVNAQQSVGEGAMPPKYAEQPQKQVITKAAKSTKRKKKGFSIDKMPSLFFTYWQHQSIIDAKNSHGKVRPPTKAELEALEKGDDLKLDPGRRYISLGGIVYNSEEDWTIWLNGKRVQPDAIPKEVLNLEVFKNYIEIKWHDDYTNKIYPLRLRSHQRFNMDMRIFLPG